MATAHGFGALLAVPRQGRLGGLTSRQSRRSGVYLLRFADGAVYVGRSVDVIDRLDAHRRTHPDLVAVQLLWVARLLIGAVERDLIRAAESAGLPLRNIDEMSSVLGETPCDERVPVALQEAWRRDPAGVNADDPTPRTMLPGRAYEARFRELQQMGGAAAVVDVLSAYLRTTMPLPVRTERDYWVLTCLPRSNLAWPRVAAVSVGRMETLVMGEWGGFVNVASDHPEDLTKLRRRHRGLDVEASDYRDASVLQARLFVDSVDAFTKLVRDPELVRASAELNLRLMRKGRTFYSRFHCPQLAEVALAG